MPAWMHLPFHKKTKNRTTAHVPVPVHIPSAQTDEMLRTCSRLIVMRDRRKVGEISGEDLTQSKIMDTIAGGEKKNG